MVVHKGEFCEKFGGRPSDALDYEAVFEKFPPCNDSVDGARAIDERRAEGF
mgnify:CR=1 FL=1